jgi:CubicO group peptidase (beta-lactamase class C family)
LKTILSIIVLLVISYSCNDASSKNVVVAEDSLQYYPATPKKIDKQEFRRYHRELTAFFDSKLLNHGFNGSILIAKDGAIIYEKYAGYADLRKKDPLTDSTSLHIASTGKTLTAMAVLRMAQDHKLSLDDSIQKFFPGLQYPGITVRMLLNHRSGLPNYLYFMSQAIEYRDSCIINEDVLKYLYEKTPNRSFAPNRRFSYSNTNFVLLALIIERVSGKSFAKYMKENVFEPLQMSHTYVAGITDLDSLCPSFQYNGAFWANDMMEGTAGDKNIYSTPRDLLKWDQALYTTQFLDKNMLDSAFQPNSNERPSLHNYGLGWRMLNFPNGKKVIYHFGRWHGFNAAFARLVDEKVTVIILGNKYNSNIYRVARKVYDIFGDYDQNGGNDEEESDNDPVNHMLATKAGN